MANQGVIVDFRVLEGLRRLRGFRGAFQDCFRGISGLFQRAKELFKRLKKIRGFSEAFEGVSWGFLRFFKAVSSGFMGFQRV